MRVHLGLADNLRYAEEDGETTAEDGALDDGSDELARREPRGFHRDVRGLWRDLLASFSPCDALQLESPGLEVITADAGVGHGSLRKRLRVLIARIARIL
eukprot:CAMPEP_0170307208 /NCGR_PEP_ID=MMETSP0116_2-20130129/54012_1 /TAXON_ID=400756 /ORGANISM="Durinskia baltica, Strain CSIRO CS-38" /LENGTH=99 /DNA_ID=CAMNT_0010559327 /DNA_START=153 /DNA_END=452 /DNA_ORIENTATION=-